MGPESWLTKTDVHFEVLLGRKTVLSSMYDIDIPGWKGGRNRLHLFDLDTVDESIIHDGILFDKTDVERCRTLFLYPDDSDEAGRLLRIYQQYFMVSNAAQLLLKELEEQGRTAENLHEFVAVQINDTHPAMIIPELIRLLMLRGLSMEQAVSEVKQTCAYTNHTILSEALEKWPLTYILRQNRFRHVLITFAFRPYSPNISVSYRISPNYARYGDSLWMQRQRRRCPSYGNPEKIRTAAFL